jgi:hypothetical protein
VFLSLSFFISDSVTAAEKDQEKLSVVHRRLGGKEESLIGKKTLIVDQKWID